MARRAAAGSREDPLLGPALARIRDEIEVDRATLATVMGRLGIARPRLKPALARLGEKLGRLKPNGHLRGPSPLSPLIELEGLYVGISGKLRLWKCLDAAVSPRIPDLDFAALAERADRQRTEVERLQEQVARDALS